MPVARSVAAVILLTAVGCGSHISVTPEPAYPVSGTITAKSSPAVEARVTAVSLGPSPEAGREFDAITDDKGEYRFGTNTATDGLPPGRYAVRVTWPDVVRRSDPEHEIDRLRGRYNDPKKPAFTIEVKAGDNLLPPFDLK